MRRLGYLPWLLLLTALLAAAAPEEVIVLEPRHSGDITARLSVAVSDSADISWKPVIMTLAVEGPIGLEVERVRLEDPVGAWDAEVPPPTSTGVERRTWTQVIRLMLKKPGVNPLPAVSVRFRSSADAPWERAEWSEILDHDAPGPPLERPPPPPPPPDWRPWVLAPGVVLLLGIGVLVGLWWWRRSAPILGPRDRAMIELEALGGAARDPVLVHDKVAQLIRSYLAARFGVPAGQRSTDELVTLLGAVPDLPPGERQQVHSLLARCDAVRFGGRRCTAEETNATLTEARQILGNIS